MLKKTVKYEDFDGNEVKEVCYFHLFEAELTQMEVETPGGLANRLQNIKSLSGKEIVDIFTTLILKSYGEQEKTPDGRVFFIKERNGVKLADTFKQSFAYNAIFSELINNPDEAVKFVEGIIPQNVLNEAKKMEPGITSLTSANN